MHHPPAINIPPAFMRKRLGLPLCLGGCSGAGIVLCMAVLGVLMFDPYRRAPSPDGMVLRVPIGEVDFPERHLWLVPALGDLDGDGYGELGLVHPREDRNGYDIEPGDALFGVHGWVTVISGSRLAR